VVADVEFVRMVADVESVVRVAVDVKFVKLVADVESVARLMMMYSIL
jgi:hypothetical protein